MMKIIQFAVVGHLYLMYTAGFYPNGTPGRIDEALGDTWNNTLAPLCAASQRASPALTVLSCQMLTSPYQHSWGEKLCINQLIFEVYSLDAQRFKSFESTCLSSGRKKGKRLFLHCRHWTMQQCKKQPTRCCSLGRHICIWNMFS